MSLDNLRPRGKPEQPDDGPAGRRRKSAPQRKISTTRLLHTPTIVRLVREVYLECFPGLPYCFQSSAIMALQEASEAVLERLLQDAGLIALRTGRVTLHREDMRLAQEWRRLQC
ncbi:histone H3-like centromeric protein A [Anomaloglossus baeobatrachus]|uniref:histone H3-like centromeric protein A n=1 Tax=Anomaloglossus baeobatrachus TaxID=238106 RepID=UPI003F5064F7